MKLSPVPATRSVWSEIKAHPIAMLAFGILFGAFVFPWVKARIAGNATLSKYAPTALGGTPKAA